MFCVFPEMFKIALLGETHYNCTHDQACFLVFSANECASYQRPTLSPVIGYCLFAQAPPSKSSPAVRPLHDDG